MATLRFGIQAGDMRRLDWGVPQVDEAQSFVAAFDPVRSELVEMTDTYLKIHAYDAFGALLILEAGGDFSVGMVSWLVETIPGYSIRLSLSGDFYLDPWGNISGLVDGVSAHETTTGGLLAQLSGIAISLDSYEIETFSDSSLLRGADVLEGSPYADYLIGYAGADTLIGGEGDDTLDSGQGGLTPQLSLAVSNPTHSAEQSNGSSYYPAISSDGSVLAFTSGAGNLVANDGDNWQDVFVYDVDSRQTQLVTVPLAGGDGYGFTDGPVAISADGRYVAFSYAGNLLPDLNTSATGYLFVRDLEKGTVSCVSLNADGEVPNGSNWHPDLSADGRYVTFMTYASDLLPGDTNADYDIVVHDALNDTLVRVSETAEGLQANGPSYWPAISGDGRYIVFASHGSNLVPGDTNGNADTFVKDLLTGSVDRVSTSSTGQQANGDAGGIPPAISADGRFVVFASNATNLVPDDVNEGWDVFRKDLQTGELVLVSCAGDGTQSDSDSFYAGVSGDGRFVVFQSTASNLVAGSNGYPNIYVKDLLTGSVASVVPFGDQQFWLGNQLNPVISDDGKRIAFASESGNLSDRDQNFMSDIFLFENPFTTDPVPDSVVGGGGVDTALWSRSASKYSLKIGVGEIQVVDFDGVDGIDLLTGVEQLQFADRTVQVESREPGWNYDGLPVSLYHFFVVAFGAAPGVTYMDQLAEAYRYFEPRLGGNDAAIQQIVDIFLTKPQYLDIYPDISRLEDRTRLVNDIVKDSASEQAKAEAIGDIGDALELPDWSVGKVVYTVFGNLATKPLTDPDWGGTAQQFANELAVAQYYTEVLHQSTPDVWTLRDVILPVGADSDVSSVDAIVQLIGVGLLQGGA